MDSSLKLFPLSISKISRVGHRRYRFYLWTREILVFLSYVDIIIFAGIHVADGGPVKCGNLEEIREDKKLKNQEIKHSKRDHP